MEKCSPNVSTAWQNLRSELYKKFWVVSKVWGKISRQEITNGPERMWMRGARVWCGQGGWSRYVITDETIVGGAASN